MGHWLLLTLQQLSCHQALFETEHLLFTALHTPWPLDLRRDTGSEETELASLHSYISQSLKISLFLSLCLFLDGWMERQVCAKSLSVSDSLTPWTVAHRLLRPRDPPGKHTGVGCHALLQGIFPTQELNARLFCVLHWQVGSLHHRHRNIDPTGPVSLKTLRNTTPSGSSEYSHRETHPNKLSP